MIRSDRNAVVSRARALRRTMTLPERMLWNELRLRPGGFKFRWQHPIGSYVADFYCASVKAVFEIDGQAHDDPARVHQDERRDRWMKAQGIRVVRIPAPDVLNDVSGISEKIVRYVHRLLPLHHPADGSPPQA